MAPRRDPLTGLADRAHFAEEVTRALSRARRNGWWTAIFAIDLDHFHRVNERAGQDVGDAALAAIARRLHDALRAYDTVGRQGEPAAHQGSDEFLLLCQDADTRAAAAIADRIIATIAQPLNVGTHSVRITASVGVCVVDATATPGAAITDAEAALRHAKGLGGGQVYLASETMRAQASAAAELEDDLHRALDEGQFRLVYQPKVSLTSDRIVGVEALLRWDHSQRGLISPADFIPAAERTGLIVPLGAWVIHEACRQTSHMQRAYPSPTPHMIHVNVSPAQFQAGLVDVVREALDGTELARASLGIEVTEGTVMGDVDAAIVVLRALVDLGVVVAIDDFGTGYSSLAYLHRLPIDEVKIDRSFVNGLGHDAEDTAIVAAIISLAHALDLDVVAEGVETHTQLERLRSLGCDIAQGFLLARPLPPEELEDVLRAESQGQLLPSLRAARPADGAAATSENIIVADDADDIRQLVRMALTTAGSTVYEAASGHEAIALARQLQPDCIILDISMPDISGIDVCTALRADPALHRCTIIMLSALADAADKAQAFAAGADDYIVKPFAPRDLVSRARNAVRRRKHG